MDPRVLQSLWPIFAAETREQLQALGAAVLGLEQGTAEQAAEQLTALKREAHSLKGSAASLGLSDIEQLVHAIEDGLARCSPGHVPPPGLVESTLRSLSAIESALNRGDAGEMPVIEDLGALLSALGRGGFEQATEVKAKGPVHFRRDGLQTLEKLETSLGRLCSPGLDDRAGAVWEAVGLAELLKAAANTAGISAVERLASSIRAGFARMEEAGVGASVAASDIAGVLVEL
ncbi:MAG: Hpt domain-containing protein, partial [Archangium sp.]